MIEWLAVLLGIVVVIGVAGFVVGRMIAARIDRWQQRPEKEPVDDSDAA